MRDNTGHTFLSVPGSHVSRAGRKRKTDARRKQPSQEVPPVFRACPGSAAVGAGVMASRLLRGAGALVAQALRARGPHAAAAVRSMASAGTRPAGRAGWGCSRSTGLAIPLLRAVTAPALRAPGSARLSPFLPAPAEQPA